MVVAAGTCTGPGATVPILQDIIDEHRIVDGPYRGCAKAAVHRGTCYYVLLAEGAYKDTAAHLPPPLRFDECQLVHDICRCPQFAAAVPLLRQDQLVTHSTFIPGLVRLGPNSHSESAYSSEPSGRSLQTPVQHSTKNIELPNLVITLDATVFRYASGAELHLLGCHLDGWNRKPGVHAGRCLERVAQQNCNGFWIVLLQQCTVDRQRASAVS